MVNKKTDNFAAGEGSITINDQIRKTRFFKKASTPGKGGSGGRLLMNASDKTGLKLKEI